MRMRRRRTHKHGHLFEATAIAGGMMILVLVALGITSSGPTFTAAVLHSDIVAFTNIERAHSELSSLTESSVLNAAAQAKANDMAAKGYFSHTGPDGQLPWHWFVEAGYDYRYAGENLAVRFSDSREVVNAWMASPTHKANIVKSQYQEIGIGVAEGVYQGMPATFVVQFFGTPHIGSEQPVLTTVQNSAKPSVEPTSPSPTVAGAETVAVQTSTKYISIVSRITNFFSMAFRSLTASAVTADGIVVGEGVGTERP